MYALNLVTVFSEGVSIKPVKGIFGKDCITPVFSADGQNILFAENDGKDFELVIYDIPTGESRVLTSNDEDDYNPVWDANGTGIAWCRVPCMSLQCADRAELYFSPWPAFNERRLTRNERMDAYPAFVTDGNSVIVEGGKSDQLFGLFRIFLDGTERRLLYEPERSGNGIPHVHQNIVVFERAEATEPGRLDVFTVDLEGGGLTRITAWATRCNPTPRFSPDGFVVACHKTSSTGCNPVLVTLRKGGGNAGEMTLGGPEDYIRLPRWSHDGSFLAAEDVRNETIALFSVSGVRHEIRLPGKYRQQRFMEIYNFDIY